MAGWVLGKPLHDSGHVLLEGAWDGKVQHTRTTLTAVLEVVRAAAGHQDEGSSRRLEPPAVHQEAHGALDHVEHVVLGVGMGAGPLRVSFEPPLGDGVSRCGFSAVGFEYGGDPTHRVGPSLSGAKDDGTAWCFGAWGVHARMR